MSFSPPTEDDCYTLTSLYPNALDDHWSFSAKRYILSSVEDDSWYGAVPLTEDELAVFWMSHLEAVIKSRDIRILGLERELKVAKQATRGATIAFTLAIVCSLILYF